MSDHSDALGGRLPLADPTDLVGAQRELFDKMTSTVVPWADDTGAMLEICGSAWDGAYLPG